MNLSDLNIETEVLPLFDYTNNKFSESFLLNLLSDLPKRLELVYERQMIIKGFESNWASLEQFTYQKIDFLETYSFFEEILSKRISVEDNPAFANLLLTLNKSRRLQIESRLIQATLFFDGLNKRYFQRCDISLFPDCFKAKLKLINHFITRLHTEQNALKIRNSKFTVSNIVATLKLFLSLERKDIDDFWNAFFEFEAYFSITKGTIANAYTLPSFSKNAFELKDFYHPGIISPVKNCLSLTNNQNVILLTGPNMCGKTTLLKAIGLSVYLAHAGVGVPASACKIPFFESIVIAINLKDSLQDGYSHFMMEIKNLKQVLYEANDSKKCFAIFDELFKSTNIDDATEISLATVKGLTNFKNSFFFISTHLLRLDQLTEYTEIKKYTIGCSLDAGVPRFTYKLQDGWSDLKIGKILFEKEGIGRLLRNKNSI